MSTGESKQERLSALLDGEVDVASCDAACAGWKAEPDLQRDWHTWHLIGDVLRSDDLASSAEHDRRFLERFRQRLAQEPVVLAPTPRGATAGASETRRRPSRWMVPSAVAAGFVLVAGTFAVMRGAGESPAPAPTATLARAAPPASLAREASMREPVEAAPQIVVDGKLIRDAQLDRYLAAHKQFSGTSALGVPSVFLRSATVHAEPR